MWKYKNTDRLSIFLYWNLKVLLFPFGRLLVGYSEVSTLIEMVLLFSLGMWFFWFTFSSWNSSLTFKLKKSEVRHPSTLRCFDIINDEQVWSSLLDDIEGKDLLQQSFTLPVIMLWAKAWLKVLLRRVRLQPHLSKSTSTSSSATKTNPAHCYGGSFSKCSVCICPANCLGVCSERQKHRWTVNNFNLKCIWCRSPNYNSKLGENSYLV